MKFKFLQLIVLIAGCAGLLCICFPEWLTSSHSPQANSQYPYSRSVYKSSFPSDTDSNIIYSDTILAI